MSKQANTTMIGAFVLAGLALMTAAILVFSGSQFFTPKEYFSMQFRGSVSGLDPGAPVTIRGVKVGQVTDVYVGYLKDSHDISVGATIEIDREEVVGVPTHETDTSLDYRQRIDRLVSNGLRASLAMQSLVTGKLYIELARVPDPPPASVDWQHEPNAMFPTVPSSTEQFITKIKDLPIAKLVQEAITTLSDIDKVVSSQDVKDTLSNLSAATAKINTSLDRLDPLLANTDGAVTDARALITNVDQQVQPLSSKYQAVADDLRGTLKSLDGTLAKADKALTNAENFLSTRSPAYVQLMQMMKEITSASKSLRNFAQYIERHPEALLKGKSRSGR